MPRLNPVFMKLITKMKVLIFIINIWLIFHVINVYFIFSIWLVSKKTISAQFKAGNSCCV